MVQASHDLIRFLQPIHTILIKCACQFILAKHIECIEIGRDLIGKIQTSDQLVKYILCFADRGFHLIVSAFCMCLSRIFHIGKTDFIDDHDHSAGITLT